MKVFPLLLISSIFCSLNAADCVTRYDKNGCDEVSFDVGKDMLIQQYKVIYDKDQDGVVDALDKCPGTAFNTKVDAVGCSADDIKTRANNVKETQVSVVTLNIEFDTLKSDIKKVYEEEIKKFATYMTKNPTYFAKIVGHTDSRDSYEVNKALSLSRADAVKAALVKQGVKSNRIQTAEMGPNEPIASNATAEGRAKNRRIEVILTTKEEN